MDHNISLNITNDLITFLSDKSYESDLGARYIQNLISSQIMTKVAKIILENPHNDEHITKNIVVENGNINIV
jgi:ATP-dependent Clp protease ATP-binding subunit ClpA